MPKKINLNQSEGEEDFVMKPLATNTKPYFKEKITLKLKHKISKKGKAGSKKFYPVFNNDGLPYTPTFLLQSDKDTYVFLNDMLKNQYLQKMKNSEEKSTNLITLDQQISTPCPNSKVCYICKSVYACYQKHIQQLGHKHNLSKSTYSSKIESLCNQFNQEKTALPQPFQEQKELMVVQFSDQQECEVQLHEFPILNPFRGFFQETEPLRYN